MTKSDETEKKRARGRKLGVRIFQEVYYPEMNRLFDDRIKLLQVRVNWKEQQLLEAIKSQLPFDNILDKVLTLLKEAERMGKRVKKLEEDSVILRERAETIIEMTKVFKLGGSPHQYGEHVAIADLEIEHTDQILNMLKISMMLQPEWLTLQEAMALKSDFLSNLNRCVTMDQCTDLIDEARIEVAEMSK